MSGRRTDDSGGRRGGGAAGRGLAAAALALGLVAAGAGAPEPPPPAEEVPRSDLDVANDVLAPALARALQTVYERYAASAVDLPDQVREALAAEYGAELERARFVVSAEAMRVLAAVDRFQGTRFGEGMHALTIDDLILLSADPAETESPFALWIWAHELHHVEQYRERGSILAFARDYLRDCDSIEAEADARANRALGMEVSLRHCLG